MSSYKRDATNFAGRATTPSIRTNDTRETWVKICLMYIIFKLHANEKNKTKNNQ